MSQLQTNMRVVQLAAELGITVEVYVDPSTSYEYIDLTQDSITKRYASPEMALAFLHGVECERQR